MANSPDAPVKITPYGDFAEAASATIARIKQRVNMQMWMMTRRVDEDWIVLRNEDDGYGVESGDIFVWSDSFCSRMVRGEGPLIAPNASEVPVYLEAPIGKKVDIGAYVGMPICDSDGELFGTLCAIDPDIKDEQLLAEEEYILQEARMLATILHLERQSGDRHHLIELLSTQNQIEPKTGLYSHADFQKLVEMEEARSIQFADPTGFLLLRILTDEQQASESAEQLCKVRQVIADRVRPGDFSGHWAENQVATLFRGQRHDDLVGMVNRIQDGLHEAGVFALAGYATRRALQPMREAIASAEAGLADA